MLKIRDTDRDFGLSLQHIRGIRSGLELLIPQWHEYVEKKSGLRERVRQLFKPKYEYDQLSGSLSDSVNQLGQDWVFLDILMGSIFRSDAAEFMQNKSLYEKIDAVAKPLCRFIHVCTISEREYYWKRPLDMLSRLGSFQRMTDKLSKSVIREALEDLSNFTIHANSPDSMFWEDFVPDVGKSLRSFEDAGDGVLKKTLFFLHKELVSIPTYLGEVQQSLSSHVVSDRAIDDFLTDVASVVLKIAVQSCKFWFNRTDQEIAKGIATGIADLYQEIDPTDPEFLQLNLRFQEALYKISSKKSASGESDFAGHFCNYLLVPNAKEDIKKELISLVTLFINNTLEDDSTREDVHSFCGEIYAVLGEVASFHRAAWGENPTDDLRPCSELLTKLCLLKAELFLKKQLNTSSSSMHFSDKHFFKVNMTLTNLRALTKDLHHQGITEYAKQSLVLSQELATEVESLNMSFHSKRITYSLIKHSLFQLLFKIVFFKTESFLVDLLKSSDSLIAHEKDKIDSLWEKLKYFKRIVRNKLARDSSDEDIIIRQVEAVARGITHFSYSYLPINEKFKRIIPMLPQLLDKVTTIEAKLGEISRLFPKSTFPKTYELGFIDFLGRNISELLKHDPESIAPVKHHIEEVQLHLESFKSFLMKVNYPDVVQGELKDLGNHIMDVAFKLEYVVDSIEVDGHLQQSLWLYDLLEDIRLVDQQVSTIHEIPYVGKVQNPQKSPSQRMSQDNVPEIDDIDLVDEEQTLIGRLVRGSLQRDIISIVGMPGSGKTTLAKKVFNNKNVMCHFHVRAWCTVSQEYLKRELLLEILSHILVLTSEIHQKTDDDLQLELRRKLLGKNYLIVMDDVWGIDAWSDLNISFPDESNGSRILLTSRLRDVALKIKPDSDPHSIRLFSVDESWVLLKKKIFRSEVCPEELLLVGMEIAQHCQGLPLAVIAIAGFLRKIERSQDRWQKISESLSSEIINDPENQCKEILELSYKHLPEYLKACFLYLGVFLEGREIPVSKVIRFWMAEGFIQETKSKGLEEVGEDYLLELINRSLVNISRTRSSGKVKACRLHDLLRDLCHLKAKDENFLQLVTRDDKPYASFPDADYGMEFDHMNQLSPTFESYRLSFYLKRRHFIDSRPSGPGARSLIFFASVDSEPKCPYEISFICHNFKLLRVLDLEYIHIESSFPVEIGLMVQLRYLAVSGYMQSIPPSIANLWKLETLIVKGLRGKVFLPKTIWSMASLRHLHVNNHVAFSFHDLDEQVGDSFRLENLVSFSTPSLSCGDDSLSILRKMPNLRKLRCMFSPSWDSPEDCDGFPVSKFLARLESLKIIYYGGALNSGEFVLPISLAKLTLSKFCLQRNHLSVIGELPKLKVLKLLAGAFEEQTWEMKEEEFKELKFLELDTMNIAKWEASYDPLPSLERLVLRNCRYLEGIPSDFASIPTLQMIEVQWCGQSVVESAEEIGNTIEEIKVLISRL